MTKLIPEGELTFHDWQSCIAVADILMDEGYVVMLSREENLYIINYVWSSERYADRSNVVFMEREDFEQKFYEDDDEENEEIREDRIRDKVRRDTESEVWSYAQKLMNTSPSTIEKIFGVDQMSEEAQDRFWTMYPNQLYFDEVKAKYQAYNEKKYERIMREEECSTTDCATGSKDILQDA